MKKVLLLMLAFISLAVMGCSNSDDNKLTSGVVGYETFVAARNEWKEPASYSYTVYGDTYQPNAFVIDVKVTKGVSELLLNPKFPNQADSYGGEESEYRQIENLGWNIKTISGIFESIEKENMYVKTSPSIQMLYDYCLIEIDYAKCNSRAFPSRIECWGQNKTKGGYGGGYRKIIKITDFKIMEE